MKNLLLAIIAVFLLNSCKKMTADYESRKAGVLKVCPKCNFISNSAPYGGSKYGNNIQYFAVDTSVIPNIIYQVDFKSGGIFYTASDVDHLIRINQKIMKPIIVRADIEFIDLCS